MAFLADMDRINGRLAGIVLAVVLLVGTVFTLTGEDGGTRTVTAHFPRAVSVYEGTDVRILGVNVGRVTAVIPEGNSVRVEIEYDDQYPVPEDAGAAIITPTLVADRFVQLSPAYTEGPVMKDGADIALPETAVPIELDRIYAGLRDLTETLGPNGVNANGTLDNTLAAGAKAFKGNGALGNTMIRNLSEAAVTFGQGSGDLFDTVTELAEFTEVLAENDALVQAFFTDLAGVSESLVTERQELQAALASVANAVGTVEKFVAENREALVTDVEKLTRVMKAINSERASLDTALTVAPVAIGNLVLAYDTESGTIGSRLGVQGNIGDSDGFLCAVVQQSDMPAASKDLACELFSQILEPVTGPVGQPPSAKSSAPTGTDPPSTITQTRYATSDDTTLRGLLGGAR